jgi:hypothetical protein
MAVKDGEFGLLKVLHTEKHSGATASPDDEEITTAMASDLAAARKNRLPAPNLDLLILIDCFAASQ